jgi:formylglycine-generating enzyme required for sulfatase activity
MLRGDSLKRVSMIALFFFAFFCFDTNFSFAQEEDVLLKARQLIQKGNFDAAIKELDQIIETLKAIVTQKKKVAEAYYLLAKVYYIGGMETQFQGYAKKVYEFYPDFKIDESNLDLKEKMGKIREEVLAQKEADAKVKVKKEEEKLRKEIKKIKPKPAEEEKKVIVKPAKKKKKKKFPLLLVIGGLAIVGVLVALLMGKKIESSTNGNNNGQVDPNYDTNVLGIKWVNIPAGEFKMGDNFSWYSDERPVHTVYLDTYQISKFEVTFLQYDKFCNDTARSLADDESWGRGNLPIINVNWDDATAFCTWLSQKTGKNIHLPTEAQWEKAARGTDQRRYPWGDSEADCTKANYSECGRKTKQVGSHPSGVSPYGIHDMAGNVWEWCSDWYSSSYYSNSPINNPTGPSSGSERVYRGGSWIDFAWSDCRSARRNYRDPSHRNWFIGFRIAQY